MVGIKGPGHISARDILVERDSSAEDINELRSSVIPAFFFKVLVVDVFEDPNILTKEYKDELRKMGSPWLVDRISQNSILGRILSRGIDKVDSTPRIFLPAFPSHLSLPLQIGETCYCFYPDFEESSEIGYWMFRISEPSDTEDVNFTFSNRKFEYNDKLTSAQRVKNNGQAYKPGFPNGTGGTEDSQLTSNKNDYEELLKKNKNIKEPVNRFKKRSTDLLLQGSHGSRIVLGQERTGRPNEEVENKSPAIDIVTATHKDNNSPSDGPIVENKKGNLEIDKVPEKTGNKKNINEGDPDFENDDARFYLSAKTNLDQVFQIEIDGIPQSTENSSGVGLKGDEIRLIARKNIKIVLGEGGSSIVMDGKNIIIIPASDGVIKLGGEDADKAILTSPQSVNANGTVVANPILSSMGGVLGTGNIQGVFASKVLTK